MTLSEEEEARKEVRDIREMTREKRREEKKVKEVWETKDKRETEGGGGGSDSPGKGDEEAGKKVGMENKLKALNLTTLNYVWQSVC